MIQQTGLFPHMTVAENVATVPRLLGWDKRRTDARVDELLDLVDLPARDYRARYATQLSGGERQRVGLARALAADPPVMLMDEPFGALDPITRTRLQHELLRIHRAVGKTVIFVTHDIDEAIMMGDRIAILRPGGRLAQYDTPGGDPRGACRRLRRELRRRRPGPEAPLAAYASTRSSSTRSTATSPSRRSRARTSLRDALSTMLTEGTSYVVVLDEAGEPVGRLSLDALSARLVS